MYNETFMAKMFQHVENEVDDPGKCFSRESFKDLVDTEIDKILNRVTTRDIREAQEKAIERAERKAEEAR